MLLKSAALLILLSGMAEAPSRTPRSLRTEPCAPDRPLVDDALVRAYESRHPEAKHVGAGVAEPVPLLQPKPTIPVAFKDPKWAFTAVVVWAVLSPSGEVLDPIVVSCPRPELDSAVLSAVRNSRYKPATLSGKPVPVILTVVSRLHP